MRYSRRLFVAHSCKMAVGAIALDGSDIVRNMLSVGIDDRELLRDKIAHQKPLIWVFTGDSVTHGAGHTHGYRSYPEIFEERIRWEMNRRRDVIINTGISGHTTESTLNDFHWRVRQFKPSVVSFMLGINDAGEPSNISVAEFATHLLALVDKTRAIGAIPILHTPNGIMIANAPERETLPDYVDMIKAVSSDRRVVLVDNWLHWQSLMDIPAHSDACPYMDDALHPNGKGHLEIARSLFKVLRIFDSSAPTCRIDYFNREK